MRGGPLSVAFLLVGALVGNASAADIHQAAEDDDLEAVKRLLKKEPALIRATDSMQRTPLHAAARFAGREMVAYLLARGADVNARCYNRFTPLHLTTDAGIASLLVAHGADLEAESVSGTPLEKAVRDGNVRLIAALQEAGQELGLDSLVKLGRAEQVAALLKKEPRQARGPLKSLSTAAWNGDRALVELLLDHGADPNYAPERAFGGGSWTALSSAVMRGHHEIAALLLERGAGTDASGYIGKMDVPLIHYAALCSDVRMLELLLAHTTDVDPRSWPGNQTPLFGAIGANSREKAALLIRHGADANADQGGGATPLFYGAVLGHKELCAFLIAQGARLDFHATCALGMEAEAAGMLDADAGLADRPDGRLHRRPIFFAVAGGDVATVSLLLRRGADVNARAPEFSEDSLWPYLSDSGEMRGPGETPLHVAAAGGNAGMAEALLDAGAEVGPADTDGDTPLHRAAGARNLSVLRVLLARGAHVDAANNGGHSPLAIAVYTDAKCLEALLAASPGQANLDAALDIAAGHERLEPAARLLLGRGARAGMHAACALGLEERVAELLAAQPGLVNGQTERYRRETPLCTAARRGRAEIVDVLLAHGAAAGERDSPLHLAAREGHLNVVRLLVDRGWKVDAVSGWQRHTALHQAASGGHVSVMEFLIERGADPSRRDKSRSTALHQAAWEGKASAIGLLLERGAPVDPVDKRFRTPLHMAAQAGWPEAVSVLLGHGADPSARDWQGKTALELAEEASSWGIPDERSDRDAAAKVLRAATLD